MNNALLIFLLSCNGTEEVTPEAQCGDGIDNDANGQIDCDDSSCSSREECKEVCHDGLDNDGDGLVDCSDPDCPCIEDCFDGIDNDRDGFPDCEDSECFDECTEVECLDGLDNDRDTLIDCADEDCWGAPPCPIAVLSTLDSGFGYRTGESEGDSSISRTTSHHKLTTPAGTLHFPLDGAGETATIWSSCTWAADSFTGTRRVQVHPDFENSSANGNWNGLTFGPACPAIPPSVNAVPSGLRGDAALNGVVRHGGRGGLGSVDNWVVGIEFRSSWTTNDTRYRVSSGTIQSGGARFVEGE